MKNNWKKVIIGNFLLKIPKQVKLKGDKYLDHGIFPIIDQGNDFISGYTDEKDYLYKGPLPVIIFGDHTRILKLITFPFAIGADGTQTLIPSDDFNIKYFYYALKNLKLKNFGYERHFKYLKKEQIFKPEMSDQKKIAGILSAYDDLIENNNCRIKILEEMAQLIYKEWFVDFKFPGHEKVKMVERELGLMPEEWKVKNLFDVADIKYGFAFKGKLFNADSIGNPVVRIRDLKNSKTNTFSTEIPSDDYLIRNGDILIGMDGDFSVCKWSGGKGYLVQRVLRLKPKVDYLSRYLLYNLLLPKIQFFDETIVGTTVAHLSDRDMKTIKFVFPSDEILRKSYLILQNYYELELKLKIANNNLCQIRDLLLPKLMDSKI